MQSEARHLRYLDCARGYAILLVITGHTAYLVPELPYRVHEIATAGWYGVQLFFLASAVTLLRSWRAETRARGAADIGAFFLRRAFRILPAYVLAAPLYAAIDASPAWNDTAVVAAVFGLVNGLTPYLAVTGNGIVPGNWSIGSEFAFYALFPLLATVITTGRRRLAFVATSIAAGGALNLLALAVWHDSIPATTLRNGLFFWFPNEISVFAIGFMVAERIERRPMSRRASFVLAVAATFGFFTLRFVPLGHFIGDRPIVPETLAVSIALAGFLVALSSNPWLFVNRFVAWIGTISFSMYLLHFAVLTGLDRVSAGKLLQDGGLAGIAEFVTAWCFAVGLTAALAWLSYRFVEQPMIGFGKILARRRALRERAFAR